MTQWPSALPAPRTPDPMQAPPVRWGILGPGWIAEQFAATVHQNTRSRVTAVGSRSAVRAATFARQFNVERSYDSYEALVADPELDSVYIASPHSEHHAHALMSVRAGKPTLVEKAFTQNAAQAAEVIEAARAAGVPLLEAMWTRFLPHVDVIRQLLADQVLGETVTVIADHGQHFQVSPQHRLLNADLAGGALLDLGVYPVSFASFVLGTPDDVVALGNLTSTGVDAQVSALVRTGAAHALVSTTLSARTPTTATISGTVARIEVPGEFYAPAGIRVVHRDRRELLGGPWPLPHHAGLAYQAAHFAELVTDGRGESPLMPLDETLAIMQTMDQIRAQIGLRYPHD